MIRRHWFLFLSLMMSWRRRPRHGVTILVAFLLYRGKVKAIFTIPELRQKILADAAVPGHLSHRLSHPAALRRSERDVQRRWAAGGAGQRSQLRVHVLRRQSSAMRPFSAWESCRTSRHRLSSSFSEPCIRRWKSCKRKAKAAVRRSTNTRATPPSLSVSSRHSGMSNSSWAIGASGRQGWASGRL